MKNITLKNIKHILFRSALAIKAIDGVSELVTGILLFFFRSRSLYSIISAIFNRELTEDPSDVLVNFFLHAAQALPSEKMLFAAFYLFTHGIIKLGLVYAFLSKNIRAYAVAGVILGLLVIYQFIRFVFIHSVVLLIFTLLDLVILFLVHSEYKRIKKDSKH